MKRSASLLARPSPFHAGVTLFEPNDASKSDMAVRRSKRLKVSTTVTALTTETSDSLETRHSSLSSEPTSQSLEEVADVTPRTTRKAPRTAKSTTVVKTETQAEEVAGSSASAPARGRPKPRRVASPRKPKPIPTALETPHPAPPRWREAYDTIKRMRQRIVAPVDTMGCDQAQLKETDPKVAVSP